MSREVWVRPWRLRWRGFRQWHRVAFGPFCVSVYFYRPRDRRLPTVAHSWRYVNTAGEGRHCSSFDRWFLAYDRPGETPGHRAARLISRAGRPFTRWHRVHSWFCRASLRMTMTEIRPNEWMPRHERPVDFTAEQSW